MSNKIVILGINNAKLFPHLYQLKVEKFLSVASFTE